MICVVEFNMRYNIETDDLARLLKDFIKKIRG